MYIITTLTKKSVREPLKNRKFVKFYTSKKFSAGDVIEIIDGNKKSPIIILKSEKVLNLKEEVRSGNILIRPLKFSKTGNYANGKIFAKVVIEDIKKYLRYPDKIKDCKNIFLKKFFPTKRKKNVIQQNTEKSLKKHGPQQLKDLINISQTALNKKKQYNSRMQELVDIIRKYFGEHAAYGQGSFSYYIGFFKKLDLSDVYQAFGEAKQAKHKTRFEQKKLF